MGRCLSSIGEEVEHGGDIRPPPMPTLFWLLLVVVDSTGDLLLSSIGKKEKKNIRLDGACEELERVTRVYVYI